MIRVLIIFLCSYRVHNDNVAVYYQFKSNSRHTRSDFSEFFMDFTFTTGWMGSSLGLVFHSLTEKTAYMMTNRICQVYFFYYYILIIKTLEFWNYICHADIFTACPNLATFFASLFIPCYSMISTANSNSQNGC